MSQYSRITTYLAENYPDLNFAGLSYIKKYYGAHLKIIPFLSEYHTYFKDSYTSKKYISYQQLFDNLPLLGKWTTEHSFYNTPLYTYLNPTEPQFTKALSRFLFENQQSCWAFLLAIFELLGNLNKKLPLMGYSCLCEVVTQNARHKNKKRKRIDNVIIWDAEAVCLEIKFDAEIDKNDLKTYEQQMLKIAHNKNITYVVISIRNIQDKIIQKKCENWKNISWSKLLRLWEKNIYDNNVTETEDIKRYRTSLWHKILYIGD